MDFWKSRDDQDDRDGRDNEPEPSFLQKLAGYVKDEAKDEAIASVVEHLSGGWITYESEDEEEPRQRRRDQDQGSFEERLQRRLAELESEARQQQQPAAAVREPERVMPVQAVPATAPAPARVARPTLHRAQGFGRKGL